MKMQKWITDAQKKYNSSKAMRQARELQRLRAKRILTEAEAKRMSLMRKEQERIAKARAKINPQKKKSKSGVGSFMAGIGESMFSEPKGRKKKKDNMFGGW